MITLTITREAAQQVLDALRRVTWQFTKTPSTLNDTEARCNAHKAIAIMQAAIDAGEQESHRVAFSAGFIEGEKSVINAPEQEPVDYQVLILGSRWAHCSKELYTNSHDRSIVRALYAAPPAPQAQSVEQSAVALIDALRLSKGWTTGYATAIVRDAIDRTAPQAPEPRQCCEQYDTCTENCGALIETLRERLAANQAAPQARELSDEAEQMSLGVMEHLGPAALTGGKMSILEAFELGWKARAVLAARSEP